MSLIESDQLREQIANLRDNYYLISNPSPSPTSLKFVKDTGSEKGFYKLDCYDLSAGNSKLPDTDWFPNLQEKFNDQEKIIYLCDNPTIQRVALISQSETDKGGYGSPGIENFKLQIYHPQSQELLLLKESVGNYLGGWCGKITKWSKSNDYIYYVCGGGDGPWGDDTEIRVNILTKEAGIIKSCFTMEGKTECNSYCDSNQVCTSNEFCNLSSHTCVQYCKDWSDCPGGGYGSCVAYGPVMGCSEN